MNEKAIDKPAAEHLINPVFPGGLAALQQHLTTYHRPVGSTAGTVLVEFVVGTTGLVAEAACVVLVSGGREADQEAVRLVTSMLAWTPGTLDGQPRTG